MISIHSNNIRIVIANINSVKQPIIQHITSIRNSRYRNISTLIIRMNTNSRISRTKTINSNRQIISYNRRAEVAVFLDHFSCFVAVHL